MESNFSITFAEGSAAQVLLVESKQDLTVILSAMNLREHRPVIVLIGGASQICQQKLTRLKNLFVKVLAPLAEELELFVVDSGTDAGVVSLIGKAREQINGTFPLIGVSPIRLIRLPHQDLHYASEAANLEPHHTHFFLVPGSQWGEESSWMATLASELAGNHSSVTILINGGAIALVDAISNAKLARPLIVINETGRLADEIANSVLLSETEVIDDRISPLLSLLKGEQLTIFNFSSSFSELDQLLRKKLLKGI